MKQLRNLSPGKKMVVLPHIHGFAIWQKDEAANSLVGPLAWGENRALLERLVTVRMPASTRRFLLDSALYFDLLGGCPDVVCVSKAA